MHVRGHSLNAWQYSAFQRAVSAKGRVLNGHPETTDLRDVHLQSLISNLGLFLILDPSAWVQSRTCRPRTSILLSDDNEVENLIGGAREKAIER